MIRAMTVAKLPIQIDGDKIAEFCREHGIRRLSLFGSVVREDFDPTRSDVDVLAEFAPDALKGVGFRYFSFGEELAAIIGRKVDFCSRLNRYIEARVRREAIPIYERVIHWSRCGRFKTRPSVSGRFARAKPWNSCWPTGWRLPHWNVSWKSWAKG